MSHAAQTFDPNASAAEESGIFGLPFSVEEAKLVLLPVPWEVTTSYGGGTSKGPEAIFHASKQVDLFDREFGNGYEPGIAMIDINVNIKQKNHLAHQQVKQLAHHEDIDHQHLLSEINASCASLNDYVFNETSRLLDQDKIVGIIGGDHAVPFGAIKAILMRYPQMGILHIDAHADLRQAYEGFDYSHASIMYNVMTRTSLSTLVQVGIRDFCEAEYDFMKKHSDKIITFFDAELSEQKCKGHSFSTLVDNIISHLPKEVYISFDIDGLNPLFCPHTGTPVPGGLDFNEAIFLIKQLVRSGRKIVGFDLNEVSPGENTSGDTDFASEWDANVGARLLYQLCGWTFVSQQCIAMVRHESLSF